jgi:hypothetical protein
MRCRYPADDSDGARCVQTTVEGKKRPSLLQPDESCTSLLPHGPSAGRCDDWTGGCRLPCVPINRHVRPACSPSPSTAAMDFTIPYSAPWGLI